MECNAVKWFVSPEFESKNGLREILGDRLLISGSDPMPMGCPVVAIGTSHPAALPTRVDRFIMQPSRFARAPFAAIGWMDAEPSMPLGFESTNGMMLDDDGFSIRSAEEISLRCHRDETFRYSHAKNGQEYGRLQRYFVADFNRIVSVGPNDSSRYRGRLNAIINYLWKEHGLWSFVVEIADSVSSPHTNMIQQPPVGLPKIMRITGFDRKWQGDAPAIIEALEGAAVGQYARENDLSPIRLMLELKEVDLQVSYQPLAPKAKFDKHLHTKKQPFCLVNGNGSLLYSYPNAEALKKRVHEL